MKNILLLIIFNVLFVIFQESFFVEFFGRSINPSFVLSFSFAFLFLKKEDLALISILAGGLITDLLGFGVIGLSSGMFVLFIFITKVFKTYIIKWEGAQAVSLIIATFIVKHAVSLEVLYSGLINVFLMFGLVSLIRKMNRKFLSTTYRIKA